MMNRWSSVHHWKERLETWLAEQEAFERAANQQAALERAQRMQARRQQMEDKAFDLYERLTAKIDAMLSWPLARRTVHGSGLDAGKKVTYEPVRWRLADVARLGQFRELTRRLSLGEAVSPQEVRAMERTAIVESNKVPANNNTSAMPGCVITIEGPPSEEDEIIFLPKTTASQTWR